MKLDFIKRKESNLSRLGDQIVNTLFILNLPNHLLFFLLLFVSLSYIKINRHITNTTCLYHLIPNSAYCKYLPGMQNIN